jgi:hypothetical protein
MLVLIAVLVLMFVVTLYLSEGPWGRRRRRRARESLGGAFVGDEGGGWFGGFDGGGDGGCGGGDGGGC